MLEENKVDVASLIGGVLSKEELDILNNMQSNVQSNVSEGGDISKDNVSNNISNNNIPSDNISTSKEVSQKVDTKKEEIQNVSDIIPDDIIEVPKEKGEGEEKEKEGEAGKGAEEDSEIGSDITTEEDKQIIEKLDDKAKKAFASMRNEIKELRNKLKSVETTNLNEIKQRYEKEIQELSEKLARYSLEDTPQFKQEYIKPLNDVRNKIVTILKSFEVGNADAITDQLLRASLRKRAEYLAEHFPTINQQLLALTMNYDDLNTRRNMALDKYKELKTMYELENSVKITESELQNRKNAINEVMNNIKKDKNYILIKKEGKENWNKFVDIMEKKMYLELNTDDVKKQLYNVAMGVLAPFYLELYKKERESRLALEKKINTGKRVNKIGESRAQTELSNNIKEYEDTNNLVEKIFNKYAKKT